VVITMTLLTIDERSVWTAAFGACAATGANSDQCHFAADRAVLLLRTVREHNPEAGLELAVRS
jgi:hypothetical protein